MACYYIQGGRGLLGPSGPHGLQVQFVTHWYTRHMAQTILNQQHVQPTIFRQGKLLISNWTNIIFNASQKFEMSAHLLFPGFTWCWRPSRLPRSTWIHWNSCKLHPYPCPNSHTDIVVRTGPTRTSRGRWQNGITGKHSDAYSNQTQVEQHRNVSSYLGCQRRHWSTRISWMGWING